MYINLLLFIKNVEWVHGAVPNLNIEIIFVTLEKLFEIFVVTLI